MTKRLIYQVYTGKRSKLYDHCTASVKAYAEDINEKESPNNRVDYIIQTQPIMKIKPDVFATNRSKESYEKYGGFLPIYEKENAFNYWDRYDQIAIIDADVWVRPGTENIFDVMNHETEFAGMAERTAPILPWYKEKLIGYTRMQYSSLTDVDWRWNESGAHFYNMGVMLLNRHIVQYLKGKSKRYETGREFIERPEFKRFVDGLGAWKWSTDQTLLNYWVKKEKMEQQELSWKWNALYTAISNEDAKKAYFVHFFLKDKLPNRGEDVEKLMEDVNE
tara:strand:- start:352 stop:1182 length:831 start_codon:yes stop_codon:yes gene_type:complete